MEPHADAIKELATLQQVGEETVRQLVDELHKQAGAQWFYLFWVSGRGGTGGGQRTGRPRTLLAFSTPDAALTFAQRNQLADVQSAAPRVRRLSLAQLLLVILREPSIEAMRLVHDEEPTVGRMPDGVLVTRAAVLEQLQATPE